MAHVLLVVPPLPQPLGTPYLGQQYVAASLRAAGHTVSVADAAAVAWSGGEDGVVAATERLRPDVVGLTLFTVNAVAGYRLARRLRPLTRCVLAGGPHATIRPDEALAGGCDAVVCGEGETLAVRVADALDGGDALPALAGLRRAGATDDPPGRAVHDDLDALVAPPSCADRYDPAWYGLPRAASRGAVPGGVVTSRGCPARCTFCANYVTGRAARWRSAANVVAELVTLREGFGMLHVPFWDDAFTASAERVRALCAALRAEPRLAGLTWTCITPGTMVRPPLLAEMRAAGCCAINFGLESGDARILREIRKGQRPKRVIDAVRSARDAGMRTIVNFMFGFPGEGPDELDRTRELMERLAPFTDFFNPHGVLVPFPGTEVYDRNHERFGFTDWWLDPSRSPHTPPPIAEGADAVQAWLDHDPALDQDYFRYEPIVRERIAACVRFKAEHNRRSLERRG